MKKRGLEKPNLVCPKCGMDKVKEMNVNFPSLLYDYKCDGCGRSFRTDYTVVEEFWEPLSKFILEFRKYKK